MTYTLVFKRYAPFTSFGGGFHGDGRKWPDLNGTARTWGFVHFDLSGVSGYSAKSSPTWHSSWESMRSTQTPSMSVKTHQSTVGELTFIAHSAGANPMVPGSPDIDTFVDIRYRAGKIDGCVRGDGFPSFEAFLVPGKFKGETCPVEYQTLAHWATPYGPFEGPSSKLFGAHEGQFLTAFNKSVT